MIYISKLDLFKYLKNKRFNLENCLSENNLTELHKGLTSCSEFKKILLPQLKNLKTQWKKLKGGRSREKFYLRISKQNDIVLFNNESKH